MMNTNTITKLHAEPKMSRSSTRQLWMGSASVLAATVALSAMPAPAFAQGVPGASSGVPAATQGRVDARRAGPDRNMGRNMGRRAGRGNVEFEIPAEMPASRGVFTRPQTMPGILPDFGGNTVAAPVQTQVNVGSAPTIPTVPVDPNLINPTGPIVNVTTDPIERAIIADPGVAGINVRAFAVYDDVQVEFNPGTAVDRVNLLASSAIINWTTFDAGAAGTEVTFLDVGGNLEFTSSLSDYTVLNRVLTPGFDSAIRIDGDITSSTFGGSSSGGNIWFYSAGGIVVGDTGSFDVGSLLLTTSDIDPADVINGAFDVTFTGTPDSASSIRIDGGASIRANNPDSYVAMVAPRIEQNGTVTVNGSVAYVAAEEATMTITNGLFDIAVAVGTEDTNGIVHGETGSTGGAASTGIADEQAIYFVAVPKNDAITMLVGGVVGYDAASSATFDNGRIILTTGDTVGVNTQTVNIGGTNVNVSSNFVDTTVNGGPAGSVTIENIELTSTTEVFAEGSITLQSNGTADDQRTVIVDSFGGRAADLSLTAGDGVNVRVTGTGIIDVAGSVSITAGDGAGNGGDISFSTTTAGAGPSPFVGGTISTGGSLTLNASGRGLDDTGAFVNNGGNGIGSDGVGGNISLNIESDGSLIVNGNLVLDSSANGGLGSVQSGSATAGSISLDMSSGNLAVAGNISLDASARDSGTLTTNSVADVGSSSVAGDVTVNFSGGAIDAGALSIFTFADASSGSNSFVAQSNDATSGNVTFNVTGGNHFFSSIDVDASSAAGQSFGSDPDATSIGGTANRGTTTISISNLDSGLDIGGDLSIFASANGDTSGATGDTVNISVLDTGTGTGAGLIVGGDLSVFADAEAGAPGAVSQGAVINVSADNGQLIAGGLTVSADAFRNVFSSNFARQGTEFEGGTVGIVSTNGGAISFGGFSSISANGTGGSNFDEPGQGIGRGGAISILADDGSITFTNELRLGANGFAFASSNDAGVSSQGFGGTVNITVQGTSGSLSFADIDAGTDGTFSFDGEFVDTFFVGDGSGGVGGTTEFNVLGGTLTAADIFVTSDGEGGPGGEDPDGSTTGGLFNTGDGGTGTGGQVTFNIDGGDATVTNLTVSASGSGGSGAFGSDFNGTNAGDGGDAIGGTATLNALSGTLTVTNTLSVEATGNRDSGFGRIFGGEGGNARGAPGGNGGSSTGGTAVFNMTGSAVVNANAVVVSTQAFGGDGGDSDASFSGTPDAGGGNGGDGVGGDALFNDTAGDITFGSLTVNASGQGGGGGGSFGVSTGDAVGAGGAGGNGIGGNALISLNQDDVDAKNYNVISRGIGGEGGIGAIGGLGGFGIGGIAELAINNVAVVFDQLTIDATATGGDGGFIDGLLVADGADGGDGDGGEARLVVAGPNANFQANTTVALNAGATGGIGRAGSNSFDDMRDTGAGGSGGSATGGSATIIVSDNAGISIDANAFSLNSDSSGGAGGDGGDNFGVFTGLPGTGAGLVNSVSGAGGAGGSGTAGTVGIVATTGADVVITGGSGSLTLSAIGSGGNGGEGGLASSIATIAGDGGEGGAGIGGSPLLRASGASITIGNVTMIAQGGGAAAGNGGDNDVGGVSGLGANGGIGIGGTPVIELTEGAGGQITLGNLTILANGTGGAGSGLAAAGIGGGGQVLIRDVSGDAFGISTGDLAIDATGDATGDPASETGLITITADSGPVTVNGNFDADVTGDMDFAMVGDGQLVVTGGVGLNASRNIGVSQMNPAAGINAIEAGATFTALALGDFNALNNGNINSAQAVSITAADISYDNIISAQTVDLTATSGSITGTSTGTISASNVLDAIDLLAADNVTFGTLISINGNIDIDAGIDVTGGDVLSAQFVNIDAGGSITIDLVDNSANAIGLATINGGAIDIGTIDAGFITNLTANVGDLAVGSLTTSATADLDAAGNIVLGTADTGSFVANALGDFAAGSVMTTGSAADLRITAGGSASYTSLDSDRLVQIDAAQILGGDLIADAQVTFNASLIDVGDITTTEASNIVLTTDTDGITTGALNVAQGIITINSAADADIASADASSSIAITTVGDLTTGDANAGSNLSFNVGGNLIAGELFAGTTSPGLSFNVGGDADVAGASTNGLLNIDVGGAFSGGDFIGLGNNSLVTIDAASVDIGSAQSINQAVNITAIGAANVGNAVSGLSTTITGTSVNIDNGDVGGNLTVTSSVGDVTGLGSILVGGTASFTSAANMAIGTIEANNIDLTAAGDLRFNGLISPNAITLSAINGTIGATTPGQGDISSGGAVDLTAQDIDLGDIDSTGSITANSSVGDASFGALTAGTFIDISAKGNPSVESVTSGGNVTLTGASISLDGGDIGGSLLLDAQAGDITLSFDGTQQLLVGGGATFFATGDMIVTHTNNAASTVSIDVSQGSFVNIGGAFNSGAGSIFDAGIELILSASGDVTANDLRALAGIDITTAGSVVLNDASVTGPQGVSNLRGIIIRAGLVDLASGFAFDNIANATITGTVTSYADINITAGGNAVFASGSVTAADNALIVNTGDDIIVEAGALLMAAINPTTPIDPADPFGTGPNLTLNAGGEQNLLSIPVTPIASLLMDGTLDANDASIILQGNAIEGLDSTLIAGSIQVDVRDAPATTNFLSDDDGLLTSPCIEGFACLGNMEATGRIEIGQNSNNDIIGLFIEQATVTATDILITTRNDIVMGTNGIDTQLNATGTFSATSNTGNVDLRDASISADQILIDAAGSLLGSGILASTNDIGVTVGDSIIVGGIITDGELTEVADVGGAVEGFYSVNGNFVAGVFSQGSADIDLFAGGDIDIGEASSPDSIFLSANGVFLGNASVPGDIFIDGAAVGYGSLFAGGTIAISGGGIFGGDLFAFDVELEGDEVDVGNIDADNLARIIGSSIAVGDVTADQIDLTSDSDILFNLLQSTNSIVVTAADGQIASNGGPGDIISGGDVALAAQQIAIGDVTSQGSVTADASAGDATFGVVDAANDITITALGSPSVLNAISGGNTSITGASVTFDNGTIGGDLTLNATNGDIDGNGAVSVGGAIDFTATGNVGFGDLDAAGGSFGVDAGGDVSFSSATSTDFIDIFAGGAVLGGDLNAANDVSVDADSIAVGDVIADQISLTSATDILFNLIQSPNAISLTATAGLIGQNTGPGDILSDGDVTLLAQAIDVNTIDAGGNVSARATSASVATGSITAGGAIDLSAVNGSISGGDLIAGDTVEVSADGTFAAGMITQTAGSLDVSVGGTVTFSDAVGSADAAITTSGDLLFNTLVSDGEISLLALGNLTASSIAGVGDMAIDGFNVTLDSATTTGAGTLFAIADGGDLIVSAMSGDEDVFASAAGLVSVDSLSAGASAFVDAGTATLGTVDAGVDVEIVTTAADGAAIADAITAGQTVLIETGTGGIDVTALIASDADLLADGGAILVEDAVVSGLLVADGTMIDIVSSDFLRVDLTATDGDISVQTAQALGVENAVATGNIDFAAINGSMRVESASGDNISLVASDGIDINDVVDAAGALTIDTGSTFTLSGTATAQTIEVTSANVDILPDGILGDATRTQSITFNAIGEVAVGGDSADMPPPFLLENFEFGRMFSGGDIIINARASGSSLDAILTVDTLDLIAGDGSTAMGQNIGQTGALILNADGDVNVIGDVTIMGATADTRLVIDAINLVRLNTATGGLFVFDGNGGLAGEILIGATDFIAVTDDAFADIQGMSVADVDLRLADNDGVDRADGVIRADTLDIATTASQVFIQNTVPGTDFDQRRGFDVNTLNIASGGGTGSQQPIVINGVISGVTGIDAIALANLASVLDPASTINGCVIANPASCATTTTPPVTPTNPDDSPNGGETETRDLIEDGIDPADPIQPGTLDASLFDLRPDAQFGTDPLIDDPVTGAGNEDLWVSDEESEESGE